VRSSVDTAICSKPGGNLAGQLLYGFSLHRSNWAMNLATELGGSVLSVSRSMVRHGMQLVLPSRNISGLVQIAIAQVIRNLALATPPDPSPFAICGENGVRCTGGASR